MKKPARASLAIVCAFACAVGQVSTPIKWACIGNSLTEGFPDSYVDGNNNRLFALLGPQYTVQNDGVSGCTLLKNGDKPYWTQGKLANVFALKPDIVTIELGTNDTKPQNWQYNHPH